MLYVTNVLSILTSYIKPFSTEDGFRNIVLTKSTLLSSKSLKSFFRPVLDTFRAVADVELVSIGITRVELVLSVVDLYLAVCSYLDAGYF